MSSIAGTSAFHRAFRVDDRSQHLFRSYEGSRTLESADLVFFQRVLDGAPCPMLVVGAARTIQDVAFANSALEKLSGYRIREIRSRDWTSLFVSIQGESDPGALRAAMQGGREARAVLCMRHRDGSDVWVIATASPLRSGIGIITHYIVVLQDLTEERRSRQALEYQAYHDPLTGLANRHLLNDRSEQALARAQRHDDSFAVVLLDMNGFKLINDRFGHDVGDELLKSVGVRLRECVREEDTVARIGGDEFVLLLENGEPQSTAAVVHRVAQTVQQPMLLKGRQVTPALCSGVGRYPFDGLDLEALLKSADVALYRAKARRQPAEYQ